MGNQCKNHGIQIQKIKSSQIIVAGLPRFNPYRKFGRRSSKLESTKFKKFRILYLGFSVPHNERNLISELISLLDLSELKDKYEFYYKPHPARQKRFFESPYLPANVQIIENPIKASGFDALPTIDPKHIQNLIETDVVISTPTSMAIESMLLSIPTIIDATNDGVHRTTAAFALKNYLHLQDLKTIEGIMIGSSASELLEHLLHNFRSPNLYPAPNLENLIESKRENYASHILELAKGL
jgi:hypothetical protein